jgi:hypothetical protein
MYAMNIQNGVIGLVQRENCKSKQMKLQDEIKTDNIELNKFYASKKDPFY